MKTYSKIFLIVILALSACRSHKTTEQTHYVANDSCTTQTNLQLHSISEMAKTELISAHVSQDHIDFHDSIGEIQIQPNGQMTIKGIRSANIARQEIKRLSEMQISLSDSLTEDSSIESGISISSDVKTKTDTPTSSLNWNNISLFIAISLLLLLAIRYFLNHKTPRR